MYRHMSANVNCPYFCVKHILYFQTLLQTCLARQGTFKEHAEIAKGVATAAPYKEWVNANHRLEDLVSVGKYLQETQMETAQVLRLQAANGK